MVFLFSPSAGFEPTPLVHCNSYSLRIITNLLALRPNALLFYYCLLLRELLSYSIVWWSIVYGSTTSSPPVFSVVRGARSFVFCVVFGSSLFVLLSFFLLSIAFSILLRFSYSDYPLGIFILFLSFSVNTIFHALRIRTGFYGWRIAVKLLFSIH